MARPLLIYFAILGESSLRAAPLAAAENVRDARSSEAALIVFGQPRQAGTKVMRTSQGDATNLVPAEKPAVGSLVGQGAVERSGNDTATHRKACRNLDPQP